MAVTAALVAIGTAGAASAAPAAGALARSGQDCWKQAWVITGYDEDGNPRYGWGLVDTCQASGGGSGGGGPHTCQHSTRGEVPCHDPVWGWWSNAEECYVSLLSPQPPAGDPIWESNDPADGAIYQLGCPGDHLVGDGVQAQGAWHIRLGFLPETPGLPSVAQLAQQAMRTLHLAAPNIGVAPSPDGVGLVGVPVWLWTNDTAATWGPVSISVPGPGIAITAEGVATQIEWDVGDGHTVVCDGPGLPYEDEYGAASPACGHVYAVPSQTQPGGRYRITATTTWHVQWWVEPRGSGAEGDDYFFRESATSIQINELHVVTS